MQQGQVKCMILGDDSLVYTLAWEGVRKEDEYVPDQNQSYIINLTVNEQPVSLEILRDVNDANKQNTSRSYLKKADVFILIFSLVSKSQFNEIQTKWQPLIHESNKNAKIILVGFNRSLRDSRSTIIETISTDRGEEMKNNIKAEFYYEASIEDRSSVQKIFSSAAKLGIERQIKAIKANRKAKTTSEISLTGETKKDGVKYQLFSDKTAVITDADEGCREEIPEQVKKRITSYTITKLGTFGDTIQFSWPCKRLKFSSSSKLMYIGRIRFSMLEELMIPSSLVSIHNLVFEGASNLKKVTIRNPESNKFKFINNNYLVFETDLLLIPKNANGYLVIPKEITYIRPYAAAYICSDINISFEKSSQLNEIGESGFIETKIHEIEIPASCTLIGSMSFFRNSTLKTITFHSDSKLLKIDNLALSGTLIESIEIPSSVKNLGVGCFQDCSKLSKVIIKPDSQLEEFPANCFKGTALKYLSIPPKISALSENFVSCLFPGVELDLTNNENFYFEDGTLYNKDRTVLLYRKQDAPLSFIIPGSVKEIYTHAFIHNKTNEIQFHPSSSITEINISIFPENLKTLVLAPSISKVDGRKGRTKFSFLQTIYATNQTKTYFTTLAMENWNLYDAKIVTTSSVELESNKIEVKIETIPSYDNIISFIGNNTPASQLIAQFSSTSSITNNQPMKDDHQIISNQFITDFSKFRTIRELGRGGFGVVYLMRSEELGIECAVKKVVRNPDVAIEIEKKCYVHETGILKKIQHPCILKVMGFTDYSAEEPNYIAMEILSNGSLDAIFHPRKKNLFTNTNFMIIITGACIGMRYLHRCGIIHRDFKPGNIFLDDYYHPRIGDFGLSKFERTGVRNTGQIGSPIYMAPELFQDQYSGAVDIYAFGISLLEIVTKNHAFDLKTNYYKMVNDKLAGKNPPIPKSVLPVTQKLIEDCLAVDPSARPSFDEIIEIIVANDFQLLPDVDSSTVYQYYNEITATEPPPIKSRTSSNSLQPNDLIIDFTKFEVIKTIGQGGFSDVFLMKSKETEIEYAVKCIKQGSINDESANETFRKEINIMCLAVHPCIVRIIGYNMVNDDNMPRIALEYLRNGSLDELMAHPNDFTPTRKAIIVIGICYGMRFIHNLGILHRDLKPENIFLDDNYFVRIGDFGISKKVEKGKKNTANIGTIEYMAPETFGDGDYDFKIDVYSFGVMLYEIATNKPAYKGLSIPQILMHKVQAQTPEIPDDVLPVTRQIIQSCWDNDPDQRPTFVTLLEAIHNQKYALFDNENINEIEAYCQMIENYESGFEDYV